MEISLDTIQSLAPDQASLTAAKKLLSPGKWLQRGKTEQVNTLWGQCQGSGAGAKLLQGKHLNPHPQKTRSKIFTAPKLPLNR